MMTKTFNFKIVMFVMAALAGLVAHADNIFYIDNTRIPPTAMGGEIKVPVKARFDKNVSSWYVQFVLPEGLTLTNVTGGGMMFGFVNWVGMQDYADPRVCYSQDFTRCVALTYQGSFSLNSNGGYSATSIAHWNPRTFDDILWLTIHVDENFTGGDIEVISKTVMGYDPWNVSAGIVPTIINTEDFGDYIPGDASGNGNVYLEDMDSTMNYIIGNNSTLNVIATDVNQDGIIDVLDLERIWDYVFYRQWFEGYVVDESSQTASFVPSPEHVANNYFYIDNLNITMNDLGKNITVPVKASFDSYVSMWDVQFSFSDGLTPVRLKRGNDMNVNYCDEDGNEQISQGQLATSSDMTHCIGTAGFNADYQLNDYDEYEFCGTVKWNAGQYDEMMLLTIRVEEWYDGGEIIINSKTTCGLDTRNEFNTLYLSTMEYGEGFYPGDVNLDGTINIADYTYILDYLINSSDDFCAQCGDVVQDGVINILDSSKLMDLLLTGEWYDGYVLTQAEKVINIPEPILYGDANGDGDVNIADVTSLVDILLNQYGYYDVHVDMDGDGIVAVSDLTVIIDILLGNR